jgi:hypothetical protein
LKTSENSSSNRSPIFFPLTIPSESFFVKPSPNVSNHPLVKKYFENFNFSQTNNINRPKNKKPKNEVNPHKNFREDGKKDFISKNETQASFDRVKKLEEMNLNCFMQEDYLLVNDSPNFRIVLFNVSFLKIINF